MLPVPLPSSFGLVGLPAGLAPTVAFSRIEQTGRASLEIERLGQ